MANKGTRTTAKKNNNPYQQLTAISKAPATSTTKIVNPTTTASKATVPDTVTPGKITTSQKADVAAVNKTTTPVTTKNTENNITGNLMTNTVGSNFISKGVNTDAGKNVTVPSTSKAVETETTKTVNPTTSVGKSVALDTGKNNNPAPTLLESVLDAFTAGGNSLGHNVTEAVNNGAVTNGLLDLASNLKRAEEVTNLPEGSLTGAVLNSFYNSQAKSAVTGDNRSRNAARRVQGMSKYDTSEDYEGKVNGSERARNLIDQNPRTEAMSAWETLLSILNPDLVKGNTVGSQRTQATSSGLADTLRSINGYDTKSKGGSSDVNANYGGNSYRGGNTSYGNGGSGGYRSSSTSRSGGSGLAGALGDLDLSTLYDLFNSRLDEYDNNYNSLIDSLMEMYGANSANLEDSYAALLNALGLNYSDTEGLLRSQYENSQAELENSRKRQLQEAYISRMMQQKNLADQLDALGLTGGASETFLGSLLNNYANNRANVEEQIRTSLRDLLNGYMTNQNSARQKYNDALINAQQRQLNARQDLLNNLYNAQTNALNTRANMRNNAYDDLFSTLANLAAKGYQI